MAHFEQIPLRIANKNKILLNESEQNNRVELQKRGKLRKKNHTNIKYNEYVWIDARMEVTHAKWNGLWERTPVLYLFSDLIPCLYKLLIPWHVVYVIFLLFLLSFVDKRKSEKEYVCVRASGYLRMVCVIIRIQINEFYGRTTQILLILLKIPKTSAIIVQYPYSIGKPVVLPFAKWTRHCSSSSS